MFIPALPASWSSVVVSTVVMQLLGAAWFMAVIPRAYARALGRTDLAGRTPEPLFIVGPLLCNAVVSLTNGVLLRSLALTGLPSALVFGTITGLGYLVVTVFNVGINPNIPRPLVYGLINAPYFLLAQWISCAIISAMS